MVVGQSDIQGGGPMHAFLCIPGIPGSPMKDLGTLGGPRSFAHWINDMGLIVGGSDVRDGRHHAFIYHIKTGMTDLGTLGGQSSFACTINKLGQIVGGVHDDENFTTYSGSFLYSGGKMIDPNSLVDAACGWTRPTASDINDLGQIAGWGTAPDGSTRAMLLTPLQPPANASVNVAESVLPPRHNPKQKGGRRHNVEMRILHAPREEAGRHAERAEHLRRSWRREA